ncbi:tRNA pseudouridine(55) synthase TruB [Maribacter sp. HTCC2170]|uniref:tRNA pseudouridine(55) synthase TruB n=1 Tax=Maribacter sp. (strain HTCC2170 / KCCM 42371) TaxID=313603 RepID=UPI00006B858E|nr:tRNA pseudouridine(55) synthase TruB [Maribacter sp. HTCC2170]EAQ99879.1 putative tRNA pseudouridine synthase [Maribacter sp. HTCC2170]
MKSLSKEDFLDGQLLLIDKPLGWSSFQAVNKLKWVIRRKFQLKKIKVGHAGTLDPLATGLLLICTGKFTKKINDLQGQIKEYTGTITLGATTPSFDLETEVNENFPIEHITDEMIRDTTAQFMGNIEQVPPIFSALKKDGKRLYEYAREGKEVEIKKRLVTISEFEITKINIPEVEFRVVCSKGTYIRSLAHDFGLHLRSGAHLSRLRRTKIGDYNVNKALDPLVFEKTLLD